MKIYEKVKPNEPMYSFIKSVLDRKQWICDSTDHNERYGCSNPDCFKYKGKGKRNDNIRG